MSNTVSDDASSALVQEVAENIEFLRLHRSKYLKYKILHQLLHEFSYGNCECQNSADVYLADKVKGVVLSHTFIKTLSTRGLCTSDHLLKHKIYTTNVTYSEGMRLRKLMELYLQNIYESTCNQFLKITNENIHISSEISDLNFNLTPDQQCLLERKKKLAELQKLYLENLLKEQQLLENFMKHRLEMLPRKLDGKVEEVELKSVMNFLRTKIVQQTMRIDIFKETPEALVSYGQVMKGLKEERNDLENVIQDLQNLKKRYKQVACKQFDKILTQYVQYKSMIQKKQAICENLKN